MLGIEELDTSSLLSTRRRIPTESELRRNPWPMSNSDRGRLESDPSQNPTPLDPSDYINNLDD